MAFSYLKNELNCSICLSIYTDPVTLRCGHNFCQVCIGRVLDTQEGCQVYSCPECREKLQERPLLKRNTTLRNIAECFLSTEPEQEETGISCTYCIHSPVPAVKSCLMCEASLCDNHLRVHSKSAEHVITELTTCFAKRTCSIHKKSIKYYCLEDGAYGCVLCRLDKEHGGHQMEPLCAIYKKKKEKLRNVLDGLKSKRERTEERVQSLQKHRKEVHEKSSNLTKRTLNLFNDIRKRIKVLEKQILADICKYEAKVLLRVSDLIQQLEIKKDELSRKMCHIEELCNMTDPVIFLQRWESNGAEFCDTKDRDIEETESNAEEDHEVDVSGPDDGLISKTLDPGLYDIVTAVKKRINVSRTSAMLLDINTAGNDIVISNDLKTVFRSVVSQNRPETPERFQCFQVISSTFSSAGRHYWDIKTSESGFWMVGMCYASIDRKENQPCIGNNHKSWSLCSYNRQYSVRHNSVIKLLHQVASSDSLRICLDYEAGQMDFYELCDPIKHLHTFTATFTEPLHAAFWVWDGWVKIRGKKH